MRCSCGFFSSPSQYAPAILNSLKALILPVEGNVRAAAEVGKFAGAIDRNLFIGLGELLDEMALHEVAFFFELFETLVARQKFARVGNVLLHQFLHLLFDLLEIFGSERSWAVEVVEESALGSGTMAKLGLGKSSSTAAARRCADEWRKTSSDSGSFSVRMRRSVSFSSGRVRSMRSPLVFAAMAASASR